MPFATHLRLVDLGRLGYVDALAIQRRINQAVVDGGPGALLLLEHDPVITVSHRKQATGHLLASSRRLADLGIDVQETDRGGDITYHGPGQLVAYPILRLGDYGLNLGRYMRLLESIVIDALALVGVEGLIEPGATGVWARKRVDQPVDKLCAMGVRIRRNVTMHGLALNVSTNLSHFDTIVPCGLTGRGVTSLHALLGDHAPTMEAMKEALATTLLARLRTLAEKGDD